MASRQSRDLGYVPALDGIRAFAVLIVLVWHSPDFLGRPVTWLRNGHLGVDLFFVLSGFLITALLLKERRRSGTVSFRGFYRRRVVRLLPALTVFLLGQLAFAIATDIPSRALVPGTDAATEIPSLIATQFFVLNWLDAFGDYGAALGLGHLWSLSVEEQFYLVWPAVVVGLLAATSVAPRVVAGVTAAAFGAACFTGLWSDPETFIRLALSITVALAVFAGLEALRKPSHGGWTLAVLGTMLVSVLVYRAGTYAPGLRSIELYTDTLSRADALLLGALLAFAWCRSWIPRRAPYPLVIAAWLVIGWSALATTFQGPYLFRFGWTLIALAGAVAIWGTLGSEETGYSRVLSHPWLRAIGQVSYGLYLWHALVFIAVGHWGSDLSTPVRTALALSGTAAITAASWFFVEKPLLKYKSPRKATATVVETPAENRVRSPGSSPEDHTQIEDGRGPPD